MILVGAQELHQFMAEALAGGGIFQYRSDVGKPLVRGGIVIVDQGNNFRLGLFFAQELHHFMLRVHRMHYVALHQVKHCVAFGDSLQASVRRDHVQPLGKQ